MVFLWVYGFPLGSICFLWVYVCITPFGSTCVSLFWVDVIFMFFQVCVHGYTEEERCASPNRPARCCGGNIHFSPPPLSLAEN